MVGWNADTAAGSVGGAVTLVEGSNFSISDVTGDMYSDRPHGVFFEDTRIMSVWRMTINGGALEPLAADTLEPYRALFICRTGRVASQPDSHLIVERSRELGVGILEDITVRNHSREPAVCVVELEMDADFADLFEVKDARITRHWEQTREVRGDSLIIHGAWKGTHKGAVLHSPGAIFSHDGLGFRTVVPPQGEWAARVYVLPLQDGAEKPVPFHREADGTSAAERRRAEWIRKTPVPESSNLTLHRTMLRCVDDIGALQIEDPDHPERTIVAAGAPWFMAIFGRDSILSSYMALPVDPSLALDTLRNLADRQGSEVDLLTEEQPGRILHEVRLGVSTKLALGGKSAYYGTIDATPLFVALLGEVSRWGLAADQVAALLPNADRALDWIRDYGDRDGDGFVEYQRLNDQGLVNQGWKDSWDGVNFADGRLAEPPIALCEVQGYVYGAYIARAWMAYDAGNLGLASDLRDRAARLKKQFNERFWLPDRGYFAIALDGDKRPVDALASNMGHCLWNGIVDDDKARLVAERLMSPEMFSGWGIRTLATTMGAYNPASYHNGAIWPHDNAIIAAGLMRYGFVHEAQRVAQAIIEAAEYTDHRLPELFCGFDRSRFPKPVPYPTSCSPQAWAATTPVQLMRTLLRFDPDVSRNGMWLDPVLPEAWGRARATNLPIGGGRITIDVTGTEATVEGLPPGMTLHRGTRPPWLA